MSNNTGNASEFPLSIRIAELERDNAALRERAEQAERERDERSLFCIGAENAIRSCPALKEWGPSTPEHLPSRVLALCHLYDGCVHTLGLIDDAKKKVEQSLAVEREQVKRLRELATTAQSHLEELRDAWERGVIHEHDSKGGTRSNRNADVLSEIRAALRDTAEPAPEVAG